MKNIFKIFRNDLKSIGKNMIIFVVIIGITILPALYAWFNIASNWDPYSNTGELSFAVCTKDKGGTYKNLKLNAGDEIVKNLKANKSMGWVFVDEDEAKAGVESGKYYAAVVIPETFSANLLSIVDGKFEQSKLQYYVNEKKNAIAPKITDKGISAIEESIDEAYVNTLGKTVASALGLVGDELKENKGALIKKTVADLKNTKQDVKTFASSVDVLISTVDSIDDLVEANKKLMPGLKKSLVKAGVFNDDVKSMLKSTQGTASDVTATIEGVINSCNNHMSGMKDSINDALANIDTKTKEPMDKVDSKATEASAKLARVKSVNQAVISINNRMTAIINNLESNFGIDCSKLLKKIQKSTDKQNAIITKIDNACHTIETTGKLPKTEKAKLIKLVNDAESEVEGVKSEFTHIKPDLDKSMKKVFGVLDDISDFIQVLNQGPDDLTKVLDSATKAGADIKNVLKDLKAFMLNVNKKIDLIIDKVNGAKDSNFIENLVLPIIEDPDALGEYISSPVSYKTNKLYPLDNYGSAMAPFYSTLALWVGGIVLVAVMNVTLNKEERKRLGNPKERHIYFGRYIVFFLIGQLQALIIALGDLFFLKVQCANKPLFVLTCMLSSFIYTLIIYSLTITFSVIGKALAVIILVIQIAGAGGTFPIEVLPGPFKAMSPFLPFKYGINAIRETVAGVNTSDYLENVGLLLCFIVPALILGLLLRKPCIKVIEFFNEKVEESDLII